MKILSSIFFFFCLSQYAFSQDPSLGFPSTQDTLPKVANKLNFASKPGQVVIHVDERVGKIEEFVRYGEESIEGIKIDGFRVLIFFDMSKTTAEQQKAYFITMYPQHKAYVDYLAPNYKVKVGNFRTELEAEKLKQEVIGFFPTATVIPDKIQLPEINTTATN